VGGPQLSHETPFGSPRHADDTSSLGPAPVFDETRDFDTGQSNGCRVARRCEQARIGEYLRPPPALEYSNERVTE